MKLYSVSIVGESNYQPAVRGCSEGERVLICHEPDNPFDAMALRVETAAGDIIGYIPKNNWLRYAIHDDGRGCAATVQFIGDNGYGVLGARLNVTLTDDLVPTRSYSGVQAATKPSRSVDTATIQRLIRDLVQSNSAKITCACGEVYEWPVGGLSVETSLICPRCKQEDHATAEQVRSVEIALVDGISAACIRANVEPPSAVVILSIVREVAPPLPAPVEPKGFWRRLFD